MHRNLTIAFVGLFFVIGSWYLFFSASEGSNEAEMAQLRQRDARRRAAAQEADRRSKTDLALLAEQGRGQELPEYLVSEIDREGNFWFVGKPNSVAGVQIPFAPGSLPLPPARTEPQSPNPGFLGAEACRDCHKDKYESFIETAHHRTTRMALPTPSFVRLT